MPIYVLIWIVTAHPSPNLPQSVATHSQEFVGLQACNVARKVITEIITHTASRTAEASLTTAAERKASAKAVFDLYNIEVGVVAECLPKEVTK